MCIHILAGCIKIKFRVGFVSSFWSWIVSLNHLPRLSAFCRNPCFIVISCSDKYLAANLQGEMLLSSLMMVLLHSPALLKKTRLDYKRLIGFNSCRILLYNYIPDSAAITRKLKMVWKFASKTNEQNNVQKRACVRVSSHIGSRIYGPVRALKF